MRRTIRFLQRSVAGALLLVLVAPISSQSRPLQLDDILKMEDLGTVLIAPKDERIVFERIPSLLDRKDFSLSEPRYEARIYTFDARSSDSPIALRPVGRTVDGEWLSSFSPSGRRIAIYWREAQKVRSGVYDFITRSFTPFEFTPAIDFARSEPVWISDDELIYAIMPAEQQPTRVAFLREAGTRLAKSWQHAWRGDEPTASAISSDGIEDVRQGALVRVDARDGSSREIARGNFVALALSPSGRHLAAARRGNLVRLGAQMNVVGMQGYEYAPVVIDLASPVEPKQLCDACDVMHTSIQWAPDGGTLMFFARQRDQAWEQGTYHLYTLAGQVAREVPHVGLDLVSQRERGFAAVPEAAMPYRDGIAIAARQQSNKLASPRFSDKAFDTSDKGRIDWFLVSRAGDVVNLTSELEHVSPLLVGANAANLFVLADGALYAVDARHAPRRIHGLPRALSAVPLDHSRDLRSNDPLASTIVLQSGETAFALNARGKILGKVIQPKGEWRLTAMAPSARFAMYRRIGTPGALVIRTGGADTRTVWSFNHHFEGIEAAREVYVTYTTRAGRQMRSCALLPTNAHATKAPVILSLYPGSSVSCDRNYRNGIADPYEPELFTSLGYAVLFPSAPEADLRKGNDPFGNWAALAEPALDALARESYVDADSAGLFGLSYGAISVLALLSQTDRFKAAVASHGAANFASHYGTLGIVRRLLPETLFAVGQSVAYESKGSILWLDAVPWDNPGRFDAASPLFQIDRIRSPLMLMHSDLDWNYQMDQFDQMFVALCRMGRDVKYVRYWGEGHGLTSPANLRDMWRRLDEWYASHLRTSGGSGTAAAQVRPLP